MSDFVNRNGAAYPLKRENGKTKYWQQYPQASIAHRFAQMFPKLEQEFGMTTAPRVRIRVEPHLLRDQAGPDYPLFASHAAGVTLRSR